MRKLMMTGCGLVAAFVAFCAAVAFSREGDVALALELLTIDALAVWGMVKSKTRTAYVVSAALLTLGVLIVVAYPSMARSQRRRCVNWRQGASLEYSVETRYFRRVTQQPCPVLGKAIAPREVEARLKSILIPSLSFRPPATLKDAVLFFQTSSYSDDDAGVFFALRPLASDERYPELPEMRATDISLGEALRLVVESTNSRYSIREDGVVVVEPKSWTCEDGGQEYMLTEGRWPADGGPCPESDATTVAREQIGVPVAVRLLRGLRAAQEADGSWSDSGSNRLANTSLAVLALASHGDYLGERSPSTKELVSAFDAGVGCLAKSVYEREGVVRFRGGEEDPRSELLASFAVFYVYSLTGRRDLRDPAEKLAGRLAKEDFPFLEAELDADNAERIQWLVLALEHARFCKFGSPELDSRIARARARIDGYHPGEGYYGLWRDHDSGFNVGDKEAFERFVRNYRELKSTVVKDETCRLQRTGLGPVADTAVTILQLDWPVSHKAPRSCKGDAAAGVSVEI